MRCRGLLLLCVVFSAGCVASSNKDKIEGTRWTSEAGTVRVNRPGPTMGQDVRVPAGFMELHFHHDGSLFYIIKGKLYVGKYTLSAGSTVVFHLEEPLAGMKVHSEKIVVDGR